MLVIDRSLLHYRLTKKPADTNVMNKGYFKECIAVSKQTYNENFHFNSDSIFSACAKTRTDDIIM